MQKSNIEKVTTRCNQCHSTEYTVVAEGYDREYENTTDDRFRMVACRSCGLHYLNPRPADSELSTIYPDHYHAYSLRGESGGKKGIATRARQWVYGLRLRKIFKGLPVDAELSLLDVGCGDGWMLDCFRAIAPRLRTHGAEINAVACELASRKGHRVYRGRFEEIDFEGDKFDVINISHVIEHVGDPKAMLVKARSLLRPGGRIVIETPNLQSVDGKLFRDGRWGAYHFPRHWVMYEPRSLGALAEASGLRLSALHFHACPVHWHWTFHNVLVEKSKRLARLFRPGLIFEGGWKTVVYLGAFTALDQIIKAMGLPTSNMMGILTSPADT